MKRDVLQVFGCAPHDVRWKQGVDRKHDDVHDNLDWYQLHSDNGESLIDDVEGGHDSLRAKGVQFDHPPQISEEYNIFHCFLRDSDDYLIEIQRFLPPPD